MRGLFVAYFLMKDVLREAGKLEGRYVRSTGMPSPMRYIQTAVNGIDI